MADVFLPPIQPVAPAYAAVGFTKTVTNSAAAIIATDYDCFGVLLQSSALNDSDAAVTAKMYIVITVGGTAIKAWELVQGESIFIPCANTSEIKVVTQSGTAWVRGLVYRAAKQ